MCRWCNGVRVPPLLPVGIKIHRDLFWPRARPRPPENVIAAASSSSSPSPAASSSSSSSPSPAASSPCVESTRALVGQAVHLARGIRSKLSSSQQAHAIQRSKSDKSSRVEARSIDLQIAPNGDCRVLPLAVGVPCTTATRLHAVHKIANPKSRVRKYMHTTVYGV